jgi:5-methylcytosine-specific restriction enzyme subunit McrC
MITPLPLFNIRTTDNRQAHSLPAGCNDLRMIDGKPLAQLVAENPQLLLFPGQLGDHDDEAGKQTILSLNAGGISTGNLMGFIGVGQTRLTIASRFQRDENDRDHFLHYLLQKVFALNLFDLKVESANEDIWDILLIYLFPFYLNRALGQGLYKAYQRKDHNDADLKGRVDAARHIKVNMPFMGRIAYQTREHTYDNRITQLIRHTIAYISRHELSGPLFSGQPETRIAISQIMQATPSYERQRLRQVIALNSKKADHPYFTEYEPLRRLCLQILRREGLSYGQEKDQVFGLLFDGAWLWEEYLNLLLGPLGYQHPRNKLRRNGEPIYMFAPKGYSQFPDFYHTGKQTVIDAKYKPLSGQMPAHEDLHQVISYLYLLKAGKGCYLYPAATSEPIKLGHLNGYGGELHRYGLKIPASQTSYAGFCTSMAGAEKELVDYFRAF